MREYLELNWREDVKALGCWLLILLPPSWSESAWAGCCIDEAGVMDRLRSREAASDQLHFEREGRLYDVSVYGKNGLIEKAFLYTYPTRFPIAFWAAEGHEEEVLLIGEDVR